MGKGSQLSWKGGGRLADCLCSYHFPSSLSSQKPGVGLESCSDTVTEGIPLRVSPVDRPDFSPECVCPETCLPALPLQPSFSMSGSSECSQAQAFGAAADKQGRLPMLWLEDSWSWDIPVVF